MAVPYFHKIPVIGYDIEGSGEKTVAVDILQRIKIRDLLLNNYLIFYTYTIKDGETPELIADKLYGDPGFHWVVLLVNDIIDPIYDWPMSQDNLVETIRKKYGSPTVDGLIHAYQTVDHYEDKYGNTIDSYTYHSLPAAERKEVRIFDAEVAANEAKRQIRLLDKSYIPQVDNEADKIQQRAEV